MSREEQPIITLVNKEGKTTEWYEKRIGELESEVKRLQLKLDIYQEAMKDRNKYVAYIQQRPELWADFKRILAEEEQARHFS